MVLKQGVVQKRGGRRSKISFPFDEMWELEMTRYLHKINVCHSFEWILRERVECGKKGQKKNTDWPENTTHLEIKREIMLCIENRNLCYDDSRIFSRFDQLQRVFIIRTNLFLRWCWYSCTFLTLCVIWSLKKGAWVEKICKMRCWERWPRSGKKLVDIFKRRQSLFIC